MKFLNSETYESQQEQYLKSLLANGSPPQPPKIWEGTPNIQNNSQVYDKNGDRNERNRGDRGDDKWASGSGLMRLSNGGGSGNNSVRGSYNRNNTNNNTGNNNESNSITASPTEIMIHWGPQKNDSVSFFSLEFAGATSTSASNNARTLKYKEIFRDPEDANPDSDFRYSQCVEGLQPGTSYGFRIRGFNGFGPGEYTYKILDRKSVV